MDESHGKAFGLSVTGDASADAPGLHAMMEGMFELCPYKDTMPPEAKLCVWSLAATLSGMMKGPEEFHVLFARTTAGYPLIVFAVQGKHPHPETGEIIDGYVPLFMVPTVETTAELLGGINGLKDADGCGMRTMKRGTHQLESPLNGMSGCSPYGQALFEKILDRMKGSMPACEQDPSVDFSMEEWMERLKSIAKQIEAEGEDKETEDK